MNKTKYNPSSILITFIIVIVVFTAGYCLAMLIQPSRAAFIGGNRIASGNSGYDLLNEIKANLEEGYINKDLDNKKLEQGSAKGMIDSLEDRYTSYLTKEETEQYFEMGAGSFEGIGTTLRYNGEYTEVESPIDGFPAQKAGVMPGDVVMEVNGEDMHKKRPYYVAEKIMGEAGSEVKLKLFREKDGEIFDKSIIRAVIDMDNIELEMLDNGIAKIKLHKFSEGSLEEFKDQWDSVVAEINNKKVNKVILDLRNNPGGYVDAAIYVTEEFLDPNTKVMSEVDRDENKIDKLTRRKPLLRNVELVVLVNEGSASASEIVAGALNDNDRAEIIGQTTVGKGVEQKIITLTDGSTLHLVFKKWLTPDGKNLSPDSPIEPDIKVEYTTEDFENNIDTIQNKGIEVLNRAN